jgi:hypothetical protein
MLPLPCESLIIESRGSILLPFLEPVFSQIFMRGSILRSKSVIMLEECKGRVGSAAHRLPKKMPLLPWESDSEQSQ